MAASTIVTMEDLDALAWHVAEWLTSLAEASPSRFSVALSGGSTPKRLYEILAEAPFRDRFPWERTHLFWGDERFVSLDSPDSNFRLAKHTLLDRVPVPPGNIHPMPTSGTLGEAAAGYQATLQAYYDRESLDMERPLFDVMLLGLGDNGHTASLFPGAAALDETLAWVAPVTEGVPQPRLTLTYPAIACSRQVAFMVAGAGKAAAVRRVLEGDRSQPAARVSSAGELTWFLDRAADGRAA